LQSGPAEISSSDRARRNHWRRGSARRCIARAHRTGLTDHAASISWGSVRGASTGQREHHKASRPYSRVSWRLWRPIAPGFKVSPAQHHWYSQTLLDDVDKATGSVRLICSFALGLPLRKCGAWPDSGLSVGAMLVAREPAGAK